MVQGKKVNEMSNGTNKYQQPNMAFQRNSLADGRGGSIGKNDGKPQNGNASFFRTDTAISGATKDQSPRQLQKWVDDNPAPVDGSLESGRNSKSQGSWDQFAENERRFGLKTDYDENIYTTTINKNDPQYKQRMAAADKIAREIERSDATNSHVAEERIIDNVGGDDGVDEEEKYSGVRRPQDFPPLSSSNNKYTPPARRAPTGQATVSGAPVDPAIISSQLARPDKPTVERTKATTTAKVSKPEVATPPTTNESSFSATPEPKATVATPSSSSRTASPQVKPEGVPNATATVERDVTNAFKTFATRERRVVENARMTKAKNDKEIKLNDLKKFADSFKLNTPVPQDLVPIIAKDPAKQKEIQEKAKRNAEALKAHPSEAAKPITAVPDTSTPAQRPSPAGAAPSTNRQNPGRTPGFVQGPYNNPSQSFTRGSNQAPQAPQAQPNRPTGNLGARLRNLEQNKHNQMPQNPVAIHEARLPPTGPANNVEPNFSRRSSGVASVGQAARLNPNSIEFRPSPNAPSFSPNGNPSTGSSPKSALNTTAPTPVTRSLLKRKPVPESERPSIKGIFNALDHIKTFKPGQGKDWKAIGGIKPAYDTPPTFRQIADDEKPESTMHLTYKKLFEMAPFPVPTMSPPNPSHAIPQVPHQHQLPFHLQQGVHNMASRQSPRQPPMNMHGNQLAHGPTPPFNGHDDHRMMPSHSAQSYASPRLQNVPLAYPSPMNQNAQLAFNPQMMPYPGAPQMQPQLRTFSQNQFLPQQGQMGPIMMPNPGPSFLTSQGMPPGPPMMYQQGGQGPFMPPHNGQPPVMPGQNGFPSPGRGPPMMINQGSQQGHQQPMYGMAPGMTPGMTPGMSPGPQYVAPMYAQQPPGQMPMRGYGGPNQFGTSPQQMQQYGPQQHRNNHPNGNYSNNKNFQSHNQHPNGHTNNQVPTGPQVRASEGGDETK